MVFLNGSDQEVALHRLGVPVFHECIIIWTFGKRFPTRGFTYSDTSSKDIISKLRNTNIFLFISDENELTSTELSALVHRDAASILTHHPSMRDHDRAMVIDCYLYMLFLHHSFHRGTRQLWAAHGANYWIWDEIIQGARTREISIALCQEVNFVCEDSIFGIKRIEGDRDSPFLVFDDDAYDKYPWRKDANRPRRWICITLKNMIFSKDMKIILKMASSIFLLFESIESTSVPQGLPHDLMKYCINIRVLILSYCAFNFLSPLFGHCHTLRFLGLDHCRNNYATTLVEKEDNITKWTCLHSLQVLDLRYTDWDEILSEEKMDLMTNIMELNIEGSICWHCTAGKLEGRLSYLGRLRIIKPLRQAEAPIMEIDGSLKGKTKLEVLDLSGNKDMKKLPTSLLEASGLEVLVLDGCDRLENVVLSNNLLRSFSLDGYGPASNWTSMDELPLERYRLKFPSNDNKIDAKISLIILEGCTQLENLFLRGLPYLVELDLSGCPIKILDFETMVVDVPKLKRLFLLGCEHLRAIRWGPLMNIVTSEDEEKQQVGWMLEDLELLCIDTRPSAGNDRVRPRHSRPSAAHEPNKKIGLEVHAVGVDARLIRSLYPPIDHAIKKREKKVFFDICISTSSKNNEEPTRDHQQHHVVVASLYNDVSTEVSNSLTVMQNFPRPPASRLDRHIEIGEGSCNVGSEVEALHYNAPNLLDMIHRYVQSLHVHDTSTTAVMYQLPFDDLQWCRVERCPSLDPVFPPSADFNKVLETIWASDLLMVRCIWSKGQYDDDSEFGALQHLHLRSCPSLQFALPVWTSSFPSLKTLHIMHCGSLRNVFVLDNNKYDVNSSIRFPELTTIDLHDVPALRQICEAKMITPKLKAIRIRGCWSLRRLPALKGSREGRRIRWRHFWDFDGDKEDDRRPAVEMEKDVWDALEWDGVNVGHHPSLYEAPVHSRYYKRKGLLRGTVLR
ncbi:hypothetical protein QOZ80_8BG0644280 [Eleusine coracana subsp. coracana]|nr:hypothetical protein QOZ80_8BG0644280 [Eleusine coracana subsp. coracana]